MGFWETIFWPVEFVAGWLPWRWAGLILAGFLVPLSTGAIVGPSAAIIDVLDDWHASTIQRTAIGAFTLAAIAGCAYATMVGVYVLVELVRVIL